MAGSTFSRLLRLVLLFLIVLAWGARAAALTVDPPVGPGMVVQRDRNFVIRGSADPDERVRITFAGTSVEGIAGSDGRWSATLPPMRAGGPYTMSILGKGRIDIADILVGDVWLCAGQSNMVLQLRDTDGADRAADLRTLRMLPIPVAHSGVQWQRARWHASRAESALGFSAVCYLFARELLEKPGAVHVGIIALAASNSPIEAWLPFNGPRMQALQEKYAERYLRQQAAAERAGDAVLLERVRNLYAPAALFTGGIARLAPWPIRGVLWYQGESNLAAPADYEDLLVAMVGSWRAAWRDPELPFLVIELPGIDKGLPIQVAARIPALRTAQWNAAARIPHVRIVPTADLPPGDLHAREKRVIATRAATAAP